MTNPPAKPQRSFTDQAFIFFATAFFLSRIPAALVGKSERRGAQKLRERKLTGAGLIGAIVGVLTPFCLPTSLQSSFWPLIPGVLLAVWVGQRAEQIFKVHDDPRIVIDEWIGAWIAVWAGPIHNPWWILTGLILFRVFDVWKGPWGKALQKLPGGWGVCMDDVAAGVIANLLGRLLFLALGL